MPTRAHHHHSVEVAILSRAPPAPVLPRGCCRGVGEQRGQPRHPSGKAEVNSPWATGPGHTLGSLHRKATTTPHCIKY